MRKQIVWRPSTPPSEHQSILTVELPPETKLPPTPQEYQQAMSLKVWGLVQEAVKEAGDRAVQEVGAAVREALPGANVEPDALNSLDAAIMMSDRMMALIGEVYLENEPRARPLLTKDDLEEFQEQTLWDLLENL